MKVSSSQSEKLRPASAAAFTLVEALVAVGLLAIMLLALYGCFTHGFASIRTARENLRATQILLQRIESLRACPFDKVSNATYNPTTFTSYYDPTDAGSGGGGVTYNGTFTTQVPAAGNLPGVSTYLTNMLLVTVQVTWTNGATSHTRSMQTYVAKDGIETYVAAGQ